MSRLSKAEGLWKAAEHLYKEEEELLLLEAAAAGGEEEEEETGEVEGECADEEPGERGAEEATALLALIDLTRSSSESSSLEDGAAAKAEGVRCEREACRAEAKRAFSDAISAAFQPFET